MPITFRDRLIHAWNAFRDRDPTKEYSTNLGPSYGIRPDRSRPNIGTERSIISSVHNRIALDVASIPIQHVRLDSNGRYIETVNSGLNNCLTLEANIDQTGRSFIQDVVQSMFDEGCVAIVPVDTVLNPTLSSMFDILTLRTGKITAWYPKHVRVNLYNDLRGIREDITLSKTSVAIIENPLYAVMNEPNSTFKRLVYKLSLLDAVDKQSGSGKLDLVIQLPYVIKTAVRKAQAEIRRKDISDQLANSQYGIAYTDATEKITQLNRPVVNNLMDQITYLTSMLYSQLGLTTSIFDGTADEKTMINYHKRTIEPILSAIVDSMKRIFLTKTGRTQGQSIVYFRDPFGLVPASEMATIADTFTRNAILSSNELRAIIGYKPSADKDADKLSNKNLNPTKDVPPTGGDASNNNLVKGVETNG